MPLTNVFKTELLKYLFQNVAIPDIGDVAGLQPSAAAGNLYVSLHTAAIGATSSQNTNEVSTGDYAAYARVAVPRTAAKWAVSNNRVWNVDPITFPTVVGGNSPVALYVGIGRDATGAGVLFYSGPLGPTPDGLILDDGTIPEIAANKLILYMG